MILTLLGTSHDVFQKVYADLFISGQVDAHVHREEGLDLSLAYMRVISIRVSSYRGTYFYTWPRNPSL